MGTLALHGGKKAIPDAYLPLLHGDQVKLTAEDVRSAVTALEQSNLPGEQRADPVAELERDWAQYVGVKYCKALKSGTAALQTAMKCVGLERGDEVITAAFTFIASATCILYQNGIPVFADIDPRTYTIDPADMERKITEKTRAIIPVHIAGLPADMDAINAIAGKHRLAVVEDACQAHGALYKGRKAGALGDIGTFSLQRSKNLTGGADGGLLTTDNEEYAAIAGAMREFGEVREAAGRRQYRSRMLGHMWRIEPVRAAIAHNRLGRLETDNRVRQQMCEKLSHELADIRGIVPPYVPPDRTHVYYIYIIRFDPQAAGFGDVPAREFRLKIEEAMLAEGVNVSQWQLRPVHRQEVIASRVGYGKGCPWTCPHARELEYRDEDLPETMRFFEDYSCVWHFYYHDDEGVVKAVSDAFHKVFEHLDELF